MTFDLESQLDQAYEAYFNNADYLENASVSQALSFVTACNKLILLTPTLQRQAGRFELQFDPRVLPKQRDDALLWANLQGEAGVRGFDLTNFRD